MSKLHEILAVESDRNQTARTAMDALRSLFGSPAAFLGQHSIYRAKDEADPEDGAETIKAVDSTVRAELDKALAAEVRAIDVTITKDATNANARADLVVEDPVTGADVVLVEGLHAVSLLALEKRLATWRDVISNAPVLAPGRTWESDAEAGRGFYRDAVAENRVRTRKTPQSKVLYEATKEHPAQIERWADDVPVGNTITTSFSGALSRADKQAILARVDALIAASKTARQRANGQEVTQRRVAEDIAAFVLDGTEPTT